MNLAEYPSNSRYEILSEIGKETSGVIFEKFRSAQGPILDIRSPIEFEHGHIPGVVNFPLFSDKERAEIGVCYKIEGKDAAIALGFDFAGPRFGEMVRRAKELAPKKAVRIHCARGGLRSRSVAWLLETAGFEVVTLSGGYKSYRGWARKIVGARRNIRLLNGFTGTGKTHILHEMIEQGEQVLDLEGLANHRGSSFGGLGMKRQPSTQHFENLIAEKLASFDKKRAVWIEAESGKIGNCWVPEELYRLMKTAPMIAIARPLEERLDILTEMYGQTDREELVEATERISKNLGGERTKAAVNLIRENKVREACRIVLDYYDRSYSASRKKRSVSVRELDVGEMSAQEVARLLVKKAPILIPEVAQMVS